MTGVANMIYMYSISASSGGQMTLRVDFDLTTDPSIDQVLAHSRCGQAQSQLPGRCGPGRDRPAVRDEPAGALHALLAEEDLRCPVHRQLRLHEHQRPLDPRARRRAGDHLRVAQYAMRFWVDPDTLRQAERHRQRARQRHQCSRTP